MLDPLQSSLLSSVSSIRHAFFTRQGGVSPAPYDSLNFSVNKGDHPENVYKNRCRAADWFGVPEGNLFIPHLVHGDGTFIVDEPFDQLRRPRVDAVVSSTPHHIMGVMSADCVSVLFVEPDARIIAAAHAGWRGTLKGIIESTVTAIETKGGERKQILAAIGPAIQQCSYEVGVEVYNAFMQKDEKFKNFFIPANNVHYMFDLPGLVFFLLKRAGVKETDWLKMDTYTQPDLFFSCRRNAHQGIKIFGDMMAGIMLQE